MKQRRRNILTTALRAVKSKSRRFGSAQMLLGASLVSLVGSPQAQAQADLFWDNAGAGTGSWDVANTVWDNQANLLGTDQAWTAGSNANFQTVNGGTVTLLAPQTVNNLAASSSGGGPHNWTLTGADLLVSGTAAISAANVNNLIVASNVSAAAAGQNLAINTGGSGTVNVSGDISSNIADVTTNAAATLSGVNAFTGTLKVQSGTTTLSGGSAVADTSAVDISGSATLALTSDETVGILTGSAGTFINSGANTLSADGAVSPAAPSVYAGQISGSAGFNKVGAGVLSLPGANNYTGVTNVTAGTLIATTTTSLGATGGGNGTVVADAATLAVQGGFATSEQISFTGAGNTANNFSGAIDSTGNNTLNGQLTVTGAGGTINNNSGTLNINGGINGSGGTQVVTFAVAAGATTDVNSVITSSVEGIIKTGQGSLDLSGQNNDYSGLANNTEIQDGEIILSGTPTFLFPVFVDTVSLGNAGNVLFNGGALGLPTLHFTGDESNTRTFYTRDLLLNGAVSQINTDAGVTFTTDNEQVIFGVATNILRKIGDGTVVIDTDAVGSGNAASINGILDPEAGTLNVDGSGYSGTNPVFLAGGVPAPGTTSLALAGLGDADGGQTGTVNLGRLGSNREFDIVVIDQSVNTIFDGTLNTTGDLLITGTGNLTLNGPVNTLGNIHVSGTELLVTDPAALSSNTNSHDSEATFIWGRFNDATIPTALTTPGKLSLSGGITTNERITIVNDGILNNQDGVNTVNSAVRVRFDGSLPFTGVAGPYSSRIGATAGELTLGGGIFSNPGQTVNINGLATDTGLVTVAGPIQSTVADLLLGNSANTTNTVALQVQNFYSGNTTLNGGNLRVGNNQSLSGGQVTVDAATNLDAGMAAVSLANNFALNDTLTTGTAGGTLALNGAITGAGGITNADGTTTLGGNNTYTGDTVVTAGTLNINGASNSVNTLVNGGTLNLSGASNSTNVQIAATATLNTTGAERLADGATVGVAANGILVLGGAETVQELDVVGAVTATSGNLTVTTLNGAPATGTIDIGSNTLTAQNGVFTGNLTGAGGNLVKNGGGLLNITGTNTGLTGITTVNSGILAANNLGSSTVDIKTGGQLTASGNFLATNINVAQGGTLQADALVAAAANVNTSGIVNVTSGPNTINSLNFNAASGAVNVTGGDLAVGALNGAAGTLNLAANNFTVSSGNFGGSLIGSGTLTKASSGVLTLSGNSNGYTGPATIAAGTLALQSAFGSTAINVGASGTLTTSANEQLANSATVTADGILSLGGAETIGTLAGSGTVNAAGNLAVNTLNGTAAINAGSNNVTVNDGGTFGGSINGNGSLTKNGGGTLALNGANAYTGTTQVNAGTLDVNGALASDTINVRGGAILTTSGGNLTSDAALTNNGQVTVEGNETITSYVSGGPGANNGLLDGSGTLTASTYALNDGSIVTANTGTGVITTNGNVAISSANTGASQITVQTGVLDASGTFAANDIGVNSGATLNSNGVIANTANVVVGGTLNVNSATVVQNLSVTPASGIVNLNGGNLTTTGLNGSGTINLGANSLTAASGSFSGTIDGSGGLTKVGGSTLTLSGSNSFTGATDVQGGTLALQSNLGSLAINIADGATLSTSAAEQLANAAVVQTNASGTLQLGGNETIGALNGAGSVVLGANTLTLNNGGNFTGNIGGTGEIILAGGTLVVDAVGGLNADDLDIKSGTALQTLSGDLIGDNTNVNNDGTLTLGGADTVKTYTSTGTLDGATLTADTYALNDGSIVNANTGSGIMTTNGTVNINSANTGSSEITVQSGVLNAGDAVGDTFAATDITVNAGATLNSNGTLNSAATLEVSGTANLNTVTTLTSLGANAPGLVEINAASLTTTDLHGDGIVDLNANILNVSEGAFSGTIRGAGTLNKNGAGLLTLSGTNSYTGPTNVNAGTLNAVTALSTSALNVASGATYLNTGGLVNPNVTIANNGTVTLFGNEQASVYNSAGGTLNGAGTLTAPTYNLSNGANTTQGANLGTGILNSTAGTVTLLGNAGANDVNVTGGTLNVGGNLGAAGATVDISSGAALVLLLDPGLSIDGDIVDDAIVNNAGTLTLAGDDLVGSYTSGGANVGDGLLNGTGTLTAATYALNNNSVTVAGANLGDGALTSNGNVLLGGTSGAETVDIQSGNLTLGSANRLADDAAVNNDGTLTLNGNDTVGTYVSTGNLNGTGTLTAATYALNNGSNVNANIGTGAVTSNGTVNLNGTSAASTVDIQTGNLTLGSANRLADNAAVNNDATLTLNGNDTVGTYTSTGNLNGTGTLTAASYALNNGSVVNANIGTGVVTSNGTVQLNGTSAAANVNIQSGNLTLGSANRLADNAAVTLDSPSTLTLNGNDTISSIVVGDNTSGTARLSGNGTLTATSFVLNNNSVVDAGVVLGDGGVSSLTTNGNVVINGSSNADTVTINAGSVLSGQANALNGNYQTLQGNGTLSLSGSTFTNLAGRTVNPGVGAGNIGALTINDNFVNAGNLVLDANRQAGAINPATCVLSTGNHDVLNVNGTTTIGTLNVTKQGGEFGLGESAVLINSNGGNIDTSGATFTSGYTNRNFLVVDNSGVTRTASLLGTGVAGANGNLSGIAGLNANQIAIANAVNTNIAGNGNILNTAIGADQVALAVIGNGKTAPGLTLNGLSPESFAGLTDYGIQVTKAYTTAALSMPGTSIDGSAKSVRIPVGYSGKEPVPEPAPSYREATTSVFAGYAHFDTGSDSSVNGADYDIDSNGGIVGVRHNVGAFTVAGFLGVDRGEISSSFLDADADGFLLGAIASYVIKPEMNLMVTGGVTYGSYEYDGSSQNVLGRTRFSGVDSDVFDIFAGIEGDAYSDEKLRVSPFLQLHYVTAETDSVNSTGNAAALFVNSLDDDAFFAELGVKAEYQVNRQFSVNGNISYTHNFMDSDRNITARLGGTQFAVTAPGLGEDILTLGVGAQYQINEAFRVGLNYRAEFSSDAETANGLSLGGSYSF
ncbi:autotransporter-associated beta strand repeat-containing protein [Luteolibacter algae]|uniref:Autotransporter-associated beta strand repeat-containing protein n=1 Tax=Luteolibacter algae TaxID=454151 RepID=A0ABW5DE57_9BACT